MRRTSLLGLMVVLVFSLAGCGGAGPEIEPATQPAAVVEVVQRPEPAPAPQTEATGPLNPLTGEPVNKTVRLTAVMVDNLAPARPQTGLTKANLVYEIEAEGQITRYMALFYGDPPQDAGPVRSARTYFVALAKEWDAYFAHVGGSNDALAKIKEWRVRDMDDYDGLPGFWLDNTRQRPHKTYLNLEKASAGNKENGKFKDWQFAALPEGAPLYQEISLAYYKDYTARWVYSPEKRAYVRFLNQKLHEDRETKEQVTSRNIIVQYAKHTSLNDKWGHIDVEITGEGQAEFFLAGRYEAGAWKKESLDSPTRFFGAAGQPLKLVKGNTWIQIARSQSIVTKK